jgi:hypothetical protein
MNNSILSYIESLPDDILVTLAQEDWEGLEMICDLLAVEFNGGGEMGKLLN